MKNDLAFFTICSKNFLAHARTLYESLKRHHPDARFFVALCDNVDGAFDPAMEPYEFIFLEELKIPGLDDMAQQYNITEFNTSIKPFVFLNLMLARGFGFVVYLDPDIYVTGPMNELFNALDQGAEAVLTPHLLEPADGLEVHDGKMLLFGIYNLGFLALRHSVEVERFLRWWGRRMLKECIIDLPNGIFVDQKWVDLLPAYVTRTLVLHEPGYNVAYWNLPQRKITVRNGEWLASGRPLRFVHFSGSKLDDESVFSRHSQAVTIKSIGPLKDLLDEYRSRVYAQGHHFFRGLAYSFNWDGAAGVNLHTPSALDRAGNVFHSLQPAFEDFYVSGSPVMPTPRFSWWQRLFGYGNTVRSIAHADQPASPNARESGVEGERGGDAANVVAVPRKRLLYVEWSIPRPDQDAGSVTAMTLMDIFIKLGYEVTFLPCSLEYLPGYYEALASKGISIVTSQNADTPAQWLEENASRFGVHFLSRGPVAGYYIDLIKRVAPEAKTIFNTVDLHFLREEREAQLSGDQVLLEAAKHTKELELNMVRKCDRTIVLSEDEQYILRSHVPNAAISVLPIVFEDIPGAQRKFQERRDIMFVGSYAHTPNVDAITHFATDIFPRIRAENPEIRLKVVGSSMTDDIRALETIDGIDCVGYVDDLGDAIDAVRLTVAPLRFGAGIKGKIGSSICYGTPCVASEIAVEGMRMKEGEEVLVARTDAEFARKILDLYSNEALWTSVSNAGHKFARRNYSIETITESVRMILWSVLEGWRAMHQSYLIDSWDQAKRHQEKMAMEYAIRLRAEEALLPATGEEGFWTKGFCNACGRPSRFLTSFMYSTSHTSTGKPMPNWREHEQCEHCKFVNRVRAAINAFHVHAVPKDRDARIYLTERVTPTYDWFANRYPNVVGSEFFDDQVPMGELNKDGIRNESVMSLTFPDKSFDRLLSFDVLEHVPDPEAAFREIYRVLDDGGIVLFTVPFDATSEKDKVRATLEMDGTITHHLPPEYHGNPVDHENGALCFRYFGWEMLDKLREIGFETASALLYWSKEQGYLGKEQIIFIAKKPVAE